MFKLLLPFFCLSLLTSCSGPAEPSATSSIKFEKSKWDARSGGKYTYRNQMIYDLLNHHHWAGMTKDSLFRKLGHPDDNEGLELFYNYETKPFFGGLGTTIEALVIELSPDSTVKVARLNNGGWD